MKKIIITSVTVISVALTPISATQLNNIPQNKQETQSKSKLQKIEEQIQEYRSIIQNYPKRLKEKDETFKRLKNLGKEVESVLKKYVVAITNCRDNAHTILGITACKNFNDLNLGEEIKQRKSKVISMIDQAQRELKQVTLEGKDMAIIKKILESLEASKQMLMQ